MSSWVQQIEAFRYAIWYKLTGNELGDEGNDGVTTEDGTTGRTSRRIPESDVIVTMDIAFSSFHEQSDKVTAKSHPNLPESMLSLIFSVISTISFS